MDTRELEEAYSGLKEALETASPKDLQKLKMLLDTCTEELNNMSSSFIRFSIAFVALKSLIDTQEQT